MKCHSSSWFFLTASSSPGSPVCNVLCTKACPLSYPCHERLQWSTYSSESLDKSLEILEKGQSHSFHECSLHTGLKEQETRQSTMIAEQSASNGQRACITISRIKLKCRHFFLHAVIRCQFTSRYLHRSTVIKPNSE